MTFKHGKFEDSATMRSYIRAAENKGWIKSESLEKTASVENDFSVSENLTENVIKLCSGLRKSGMIKQAEELEKKFFIYKKAEALYDVSGETGDDLVDAAHPDGSHKLENVEGPESVVETILEQRKKNLEVINKKPTGKLASNKDILKAVKIALAQSMEVSNELKQQYAHKYLIKVSPLIEKANKDFKIEFSSTTIGGIPIQFQGIARWDLNIKEIRSELAQAQNIENVTAKLINDIITDIGDLNSSVVDLPTSVQSSLNAANGHANDALNILKGAFNAWITSEESKKQQAVLDEEEKPKKELLKQKNFLMKQLNSWATDITNSKYSDKQKDYALKWIVNQKNEVNIADSLESIHKVSQASERFYNAWISNLVNSTS